MTGRLEDNNELNSLNQSSTTQALEVPFPPPPEEFQPSGNKVLLGWSNTPENRKKDFSHTTKWLPTTIHVVVGNYFPSMQEAWLVTKVPPEK